ncbi:MAG: hypothetical protein R6T87_11740, partial [Marinobacter sp.]
MGDAVVTGYDQVTVAGLIDEQWLDELAHALSEQAWLTLELSARLPEGLLAALLKEVTILHKTDAMSRAGIGRGADLMKNRSVRRDRIAWLEGYSEPQALLFRFLGQLREGLNQRLFLGLKRFEAHYATYQSGDFYKRHVDIVGLHLKKGFARQINFPCISGKINRVRKLAAGVEPYSGSVGQGNIRTFSVGN